MKRADKGFTILETLIALGVLLVITIAAVNALTYSANASGRLSVKSELFENARIAVDFISNQIRVSDKIEFNIAPNGTLRSIKCIRYLSANKQEQHIINYNSAALPGDVKYHRLEFGNNELASYIAHIKARIDGDILFLQVITDDRLNYYGKPEAEPIVLSTKIRMFNKKI